MKNGDLNVKNLPETLANSLSKLKRHAIIFFILFVAAAYGFVLYRISTLSNVAPSSDAVSSRSKAPRINKDLVDQLHTLNDNSVSVHALFNEARNNPFNE